MDEKKAIAPFLPVMMLLVATLFYMYEFLLRVAPNVMYADLSREFGLDAEQYGILLSIYYWSYAALQFPVGILTDKFGPRRLLTFAIFLCAFSTILFAMTQSIYVLYFARLCIGAGSAFAIISCFKIASVWFRPSLFPILAGLILAVGTTGASAQSLLAVALNYYDWRTINFALGGLGLLIGIAAWLTIRDQNPDSQPINNKNELNILSCIKVICRMPQAWLIAIYALLITGPSDAFGGGWAVPYLTQGRDFSRDLATNASVMVFVGMALGSPCMGWLSDRLNSRKIPMYITSAMATCALSLLIYLPSISSVLIFALILIFGFSATYVMAFVVIRDISHTNYVGTAVGFVNMMSMVGSALLSWLVGVLIKQKWDGQLADGHPFYELADFQYGLTVLPLFFLASTFIILPLIKETAARKESSGEQS